MPRSSICIVSLLAYSACQADCLVRVSLAGPPTDSAWEMTFHDEFARDELDTEKWMVASDAPDHVRSVRRPENVEVKDGVCRLYNRKEQFAGRAWTGGYISTKTFKQKTGYFEARIKIAAAAGLNNGFWLTPEGKPQTAGYFEIDVAANYYPDNMETYLCDLDVGKREILREQFKTPVDLSKDYHVYALLWTDKELIWYFDGTEIRRAPSTICRREIRVRLSTAVTPHGGPESDAIDGTSVNVDYVRVFKKLGKIPAFPAPLDGMQ